MNIKKRPKPRLERRNASKNIDYDASASPSTSTSSSFDNLSTPITRSLDVFQLSGRKSFRIEGIDGEFDRICRSLGLSGPEDFAIPAAAWEARKIRSPSDQFSGSRCSDNHKSSKLEVRGLSVDDLSDSFAAKVSFDDVVKRESELSRLKKGLYSARVGVGVGGEVKHENDELAQLNIVKDSVSVRCTRNGAGGIKGVRPPVLAPPPGMSLSVVDNLSSTWDIFRSFGPQDDEGLGGPGCVRAIGSSNEDEDEEYEGVDDRIIDKQDLNVRGTSDFSASCSDTSDNDNHDDSFSTTMESLFFISPNGQFRRNINSWQKGDFLGSGSFGTVYEGFTDDGFFFAVKEVSLLDQGSQGKQSIYQLQQEISLLSRLKHENIVQYLGTDKNDSKLYIFLELVTKGSLASLYQKYHLRDSQVSAYTRQILNGLNYLHGQNVIHRDIKCANILVDVNGYVKLADFGLAKATKFNEVKSCKGTPFWMAPEVVNQKGCGYGHAADIWSLGCTVLEMLTRKIPYSHLEGMQALFRIGRGEPPHIPNSLSRDAQDFVLKCLQVDPDGRPTAAQLLGHPFVKRPLGALLSPASPNFYGMQS